MKWCAITSFEQIATLDTTFEIDFDYDLASQKYQIHSGSLATPIGILAFSGQIFLIRRIKSVRVALSKIEIENLPQYIPSFSSILPLNLGFSGRVNSR